MNVKIEKKEYEAPQMTVVDVQTAAPLLSASQSDTAEDEGWGDFLRLN